METEKGLRLITLFDPLSLAGVMVQAALLACFGGDGAYFGKIKQKSRFLAVRSSLGLIACT